MSDCPVSCYDMLQSAACKASQCSWCLQDFQCGDSRFAGDGYIPGHGGPAVAASDNGDDANLTPYIAYGPDLAIFWLDVIPVFVVFVFFFISVFWVKTFVAPRKDKFQRVGIVLCTINLVLFWVRYGLNWALHPMMMGPGFGILVGFWFLLGGLQVLGLHCLVMIVQPGREKRDLEDAGMAPEAGHEGAAEAQGPLPKPGSSFKFIVEAHGKTFGLRVGKQHERVHDPYRCKGGGVEGEYGFANSLQICSPEEAMTLVYSNQSPHKSKLLDENERHRCINVYWWKFQRGQGVGMYDAYPKGPAKGMKWWINPGTGTIDALDHPSWSLGVEKTDIGAEEVVKLFARGSPECIKLLRGPAAETLGAHTE
eukprot:TRINITY_DN42021_c0_g1_i1.p1 TRINITY_DN42021_c0_g1~~TRINITY_DN42021_c0_g1_i1.p1  ORF type:complete len:367 (-),score=63.84 TRINITY_DN42021_c0_g1_i1:129-1229(-)